MADENEDALESEDSIDPTSNEEAPPTEDAPDDPPATLEDINLFDDPQPEPEPEPEQEEADTEPEPESDVGPAPEEDTYPGASKTKAKQWDSIKAARDEAKQRAEAAEKQIAELNQTIEQAKSASQTVQDLEAQIEERDKMTASMQERLRLSDAKQDPKYIESSQKEAAVKSKMKEFFEKIDELEGIDVNAVMRGERQAYNDAALALRDSPMDLDTFKDLFTAKQGLSQDTQSALEAAANDAKAWEENAPARITSSIRSGRETLKSQNPQFVPGTDEFKALPESIQQHVSEINAEAEKDAQAFASSMLNSKADATAHAFQVSLTLKHFQRTAQNTQAQLKEVTESAAKKDARIKELEGMLESGGDPISPGGSDAPDGEFSAADLDPFST